MLLVISVTFFTYLPNLECCIVFCCLTILCCLWRSSDSTLNNATRTKIST